MMALKKLAFNAVRQLIFIFKRQPCLIDGIEKTTNGYNIIFYYIGKRQVFIKSAEEIYANQLLLDEFTPAAAALVGFTQR